MKCRNGHPWGPSPSPGILLVTLGWSPCMCRFEETGLKGHHRINCAASGCGETWYQPKHMPQPGERGKVTRSAAIRGELEAG